MAKHFAKITINCSPHESVEVRQWPISEENRPDDKSRISVEYQGLSYSFVLDGGTPTLQTWTTTPDGEIDKLIAFAPLINSSRLSLNASPK